MELKTGKWVQTKNKNDVWEDSSFKMQSMRTEMAFYKRLLDWLITRSKMSPTGGGISFRWRERSRTHEQIR